MMNECKKKRLIDKGWKIGDVKEFLQLSPEEAAYIEFKLKLSDRLESDPATVGYTTQSAALELKD